MRQSIRNRKAENTPAFLFSSHIQPKLFDGLIFIIDFPADGTYGPVIDDKGSVLLFLEHVNNKFAIPGIPTVVQGDLEIETAFTGFRNGRLDRNTLHICKRRPQNMVKNGQFFHIFFYDTVFGKHTGDLIITGLLEHHRRPNLRGQAVEFRFGSHAANSRILLQGTLDLVSNRLHRNTSRAYPRNGCRKIVIPGRNSSVFQLQGESFTNRNSQSVPLMCGDDQEAFGFFRFQLLEIPLRLRTRPAPCRRELRQQHMSVKSIGFRVRFYLHRNDVRQHAIVCGLELIGTCHIRRPSGILNFRARGYILNHGLGGYIPVLKSHRKCHAAPPANEEVLADKTSSEPDSESSSLQAIKPARATKAAHMTANLKKLKCHFIVIID